MLKKACFLVFFLMPVLLLCQSPGYMGKKTVLGGGIYVNPLLFGSTANNKTLIGNDQGSATTGYFSLNCSYELFVERVIGNKWLFGISGRYIHTGYDNRVRASGSEHPANYYQINAFTINPYFKHYSRHSLAPLGRYFLIGPSLNIISTKHDNYMYLPQTTTNGHDTLITDFGPKKQKHFSGDLVLGFGKTRIINHKILVDYGCNFGVLSVLTFFESVDSQLLLGVPTRQEYIDHTAKSRLRGANRFNVFLRVGYLF